MRRPAVGRTVTTTSRSKSADRTLHLKLPRFFGATDMLAVTLSEAILQSAHSEQPGVCRPEQQASYATGRIVAANDNPNQHHIILDLCAGFAGAASAGSRTVNTEPSSL